MQYIHYVASLTKITNIAIKKNYISTLRYNTIITMNIYY